MINQRKTTEDKVVKIEQIKSNPNNPRVIKDVKFKKLVKSIQEFPEMLEARPLVCRTDKDGKYIVIGGNMRLKASLELKLPELPIILADSWNEEQINAFILKDNISFGEWDWDELANEWDEEQLKDWGLELNVNFDFQPIIDPSTTHKDINDDDILKKAQELADKFISESKNLLVMCPNCGHDFKVSNN